MTFRPLASNLRPSPRLFLCPSWPRTMKLAVIFATANPESPTISATLKEGKYLCDILLLTMLLNWVLSSLSEGKNWTRGECGWDMSRM